MGNKKPSFPVQTKKERENVIRLWDTMPGYTCYMDALYRIANTETN